MRTIAIINQKGGCGKTTVAINLAAVLAEQGDRTLLVDVDPQAHCALGLAVPEAQVDRSIADLLRNGLNGSIGFDDIVWQIARNFDLAPSTMSLAGMEQELAGASDRDRRLVQLLSTVRDKYDYCVVDCPPSIGLLTFNALRAADEVLVPIETGYFAMQGSIRQEATIEMLARRAGHHVRFKALATMYDVRTKLAREILSELRRQFGDKLLPIVVHFNAKLKEAASFGQAITEYDSASRGYQDFEKLVAWLKSNPPQRPLAPEQAEASSPALSRAAELVERARALSARTAELAQRLSTDPDMSREPAIAVATVTAAPERAVSSPGASTAGAGMPAAATAPAAAVAAAPASITAAGAAAATAVAEPPATDRASAKPNLQAKLARVYGARPTTQGLLFVQPANAAERLYVAGDFNNWSPTATPLKRDEHLGVWQACIPVPPGRYRYRLVVDGTWKQDPFNTYVEANPFGELNNVVELQTD